MIVNKVVAGGRELQTALPINAERVTLERHLMSGWHHRERPLDPE